jgi:hypothetical protein
MCAKRRDSNKDLDAIFEGLLNSIEETPSMEIADELRSADVDVDAIAGDVKQALLAGVKRFEQRNLIAAREKYKSRMQEPKKYVLPSTPVGRRDQFFALLAMQPQMKTILTVQHRDFSTLTDADIESALEELGELGFFDKPGSGDPK